MNGSSPASAVLKDGAAVYTPGLSERRGSTSKFLHADALGSTRGITDSSQSVTDAVLYDAFGNVLSRTGTTPTPFGFVGASQYQMDSDSGLQLLGHRYYDPSIGRFISSDPAKAGTNWYAYCNNSPLTGVDPLGLDVGPGGVDNQLPWPILIQGDGKPPAPVTIGGITYNPVIIPGNPSPGWIALLPPGQKVGGDNITDVDVVWPFYPSMPVAIHDKIITLRPGTKPNQPFVPGSPISATPGNGVFVPSRRIINPANPGDYGWLPNDPWWVFGKGAPMGTNPKGQPDWSWPTLGNPNQGAGDKLPKGITRPGLLTPQKPVLK